MILHLVTILVWIWCGWIWYCTWHAWRWHKRAMAIYDRILEEQDMVEARLGTSEQPTREEIHALIESTNTAMDEASAYDRMSKYWTRRSSRPWRR